MELRHLRQFVAVAEELHFARAAARLGMEQSPLSRSIRNLEEELGIILFHRTTRRTWLTRTGARLYTDAQRILADVDSTTAAFRDGGTDPSCRIRLGLTEHAAVEPFTRFLFGLEHGRPSMPVDLREIAPAEVPRMVADGELNVAIVLDAVEATGLRRVRAWAEPFSVVAPIDHPLAERERISLRDIATECFVLAHAGVFPGYAAQIDDLFARHDVRPSKRTIVKHQNTMVSFTSNGRGLALLPQSIAQGLTNVAVIPLAESDAEMVSWLVYRDGDPSDAVSFAFEVASVIDAGGELPPDTGGAP